MGSPATLDPTPTRLPNTPTPDRDALKGQAELLAHLQTPAAEGGHEFGDWPVDQIAKGLGGDLAARHRHDHIRLADQFHHTHPELQRDPVRDAEHAFDQLNPDYGVPADTANPYGHRDLQRRERAMALGVRVAVHDTRQNGRNPVIWQAGQDYRMADAIQAARSQLVQVRSGPERPGPER